MRNDVLIYLFLTIIFILLFPMNQIYMLFDESVEKFSIADITSLYGYIDDNIANGNNLSWSNKLNPYIDITQKGKRNSIIYQSNGIPLSYENHSTTPVENSMFYFSDYSCKPECCLFSPYSCSNGCVCWQAPKELEDLTLNINRTSPRS